MKQFAWVLALIAAGLSACTSQTSPSKQQEPVTETAFQDAPEWSKKAVWYQIFAERFRNGDPSNDPTKEDIVGSYPGYIPENWSITPWTQDWFKPDAYFTGLENEKDLDGNPIASFNQKVQLRRYGGDLQGVLDQVDYIKNLGVTAIYFNPLNDSPSLHKYDARNWRHIDVNMGPNPKRDKALIAQETPTDPSTWVITSADSLFIEVVKAFHKEGIRVILDYSWNHTGSEFWAWKDVVLNQEKSPYKDWYWVQQFDDVNTPENEFTFSGWFGVKTLPEIRETEFIDHKDGIKPAEGNIASEAVKNLIFNISKRWLDPNNDGDLSDGIDGYRLDVAAEVPFGFWREYRKVVRSVNPDAYLLGEIWWEQWPNKLLDPAPFVQGDIFDAPMNYRWYRSARYFFNQAPNATSAQEFVDSLNSYNQGISKDKQYAMMNLTSSHDAPRTLTSLFNKNFYKKNCSPYADSSYKISAPDSATIATYKNLLLHQFTFVGAPHIYSGDEMGMWGEDDPSNRKPLIWPDLTFENESVHPRGFERTNDKVVFNKNLHDYIAELAHMRNAREVLQLGELKFIYASTTEPVLAYSRFNSTQEVICVFNQSNKQQTIEVATEKQGTYTNILTGLNPIESNGKMSITIAPFSALALELQN